MWTGTTNPCWLSGLGWASTYAVTPPGATARACAPSIATGLPARLSGVIAIVSGVIAIAMFSGFPRAQTVTIGPGLFVAVRIAVSVTGAAAPGRRPPAPTTYAVWPSGLIAICAGPRPTLIGLPAVLLAARIGVTVSSPAFAT